MKEEFFKEFFEKSPTAYSCVKVIYDHNGVPCDYLYLAINKEYEMMMELQDFDVLNKRFYEVFPNGWDGESVWIETLKLAILDYKAREFDIHRPKLQKWIRVKIFPLYTDIFACMHYDVTNEYLLDIEVEGFLKVNIDMLCVADIKGNFLKVNKAFKRILGYKAEDLEGKPFYSLINPEDIPSTIDAMKKLEDQEVISSFVNRVRGKDGTYRYLEWHSQPNGKYIYSSARDITEKRKLEMELYNSNEDLKKITEELKKKNADLKVLAVTDELTGLYNRHFLDQRIENEMKRSDSENQPISLVILDMDHFKRVNDTWGHPVGDEVLKQTANLANSIISPPDFLVRIGGEEFVILMPQSNLHGAVIVAEHIRIAIEKYEYPGVGHLTSSFGVAERNPHETFYKWYKRADEALYRAKEEGRNRVVSANDQLNLLSTSIQLEWKSEWESGIDIIDEQHKELFESANHLINSYLTNISVTQTLPKLDKVINHIIDHFCTEERALIKVGYPEYERHKEIHNGLVKKALHYRKLYKTGEIKASEFFSFLIDEVIVGHTLNSDVEFMEYTKKKVIE